MTPLSPAGTIATHARSIALAACCAVILAASANAQVELRGGAWVDDTVVELGPAGVRVAAADSRSRVIGWHEVKRVGGEFEERAQPYRALSDEVWRAWLRLQRGDYDLAEPIFERLWQDASRIDDGEGAPPAPGTPRLEGPTGLVIAEGAARVRLVRGALASAVEPWATSVALRRAIVGDAASSITLLDPQLPPVFVQSLAAERLATLAPNPVIEEDPVASALFALYRWSAQRACAQDARAPDATAIARVSPDVALAMHLAHAQHADSSLRGPASEALQSLARTEQGTWREAWARYGVGSARLASESDRTRLLGVVELLHIPARFQSTQRYLAGLALAESSLEFRQRGEPDRAATLRAELERASPTHPAIAWMDRAAAERTP